MKKFHKSKINGRIINSLKRISFVALGLFLILSMGGISGTNSFFMDTATSTGNTMTAGYWIPEITVTADHAPDGVGGWYQPAPCFTVTSTITDVTIFWELTGDHPALNGNFPYPGGCVNIPEGIWTLSVYAQNNANSGWKSEIVTQNYKVDTNNPVAEITAPADGASVSGSVSIKGTASDLYIKSYRLQITGPDNYDSGYIDTTSFTNSWIYTWDTTAIHSGDYEIKLTARDLAGHETNDEIDVAVVDEAQAGDVVINEVMWMGSFGHTADEWIELRNMTGHEIDIGQWEIENAKHSGGSTFQIPASKSIPANGYFLIANYPKTSSNTELNVDVDVVNNDISLYDSSNGNLVLKNTIGTVIDSARDGSSWPAGWHGILFHMSMERNNSPGDGLSGSSWHTCVDYHCNNTTYWDHEDGNFGTPGHANLSVNDPSDPQYDPAVMEQEYFDEQETAVEEESTEPAVPAVETPVSDTVPAVEESADPEPATEDPVVETPAPPADPEVTPEVVPDAVEKPAVEEEKPQEEVKDVPEEVKKETEEIKPEEPQEEKAEEEPSENQIISEAVYFFQTREMFRDKNLMVLDHLC